MRAIEKITIYGYNISEATKYLIVISVYNLLLNIQHINLYSASYYTHNI